METKIDNLKIEIKSINDEIKSLNNKIESLEKTISQDGVSESNATTRTSNSSDEPPNKR